MNIESKLSATLTAASIALTLLAAAPAAAAELRCNSSPGGDRYCRADTSRGVELLYQHSGHPCYQHDTWGFDNNGVWVANGCSATFRVGNPEHERGNNDDTAAAVGLGVLALAIIGSAASENNNDRPYSNRRDDDDDYNDNESFVITCESKKNKYRHCPTNVPNHVELLRQKSKSSCRLNKSWGFDRRGVWVSKGCRADFAVY